MNATNRAIVNIILQEIVDDENSDSSEDDQLFNEIYRIALRRREKRPRIQGYSDDVLVLLLSDADFKSHFRMTKNTFEALLNILGPKLAPARVHENRLRVGRHPIEPRKQLLIAIWTLATPDSYRSICERFGVGRATGVAIVRRVVRALISIRSSIIKWPSEKEALGSAKYFEQIDGFPGVIGMIDATDIKIDAPHEDPEAYVNRKGYHSIHLQVICQQNLKFIDCFAGYPGSVHDNRVFQLSGVQKICNTESYFPNDTHLLGDAAYTNQKHLLVPVVFQRGS